MAESFERAKILFFEGVAHFEAGRFDGAEGSFRASLAQVPGRDSTLGNLGATLVKLGKAGEALGALEQAVAIEPGDLDARSYQGIALADLGRHEEALACHEQVLSIDRHRVANLFHGGMALQALRRHDEALAAFAAVVGMRPDDGEAWFRHGQTLQFLERHVEALASYDKALVSDRGHAQAWSNRGGILRDMKRLDEAAIAYERAIAAGADAELNGYFLSSVRGAATPTTAPARYVEPLFDDYAATFDRHLVDDLKYQAHTVLVEGLRALGGRRYRSALDLGCGTGLCGPLLEPIVERLEGVDLSGRMIERARALECVYDRLVHADIAKHLRTTDRRHDLVLAADVFIYIGDLRSVFHGVQRVTEAGAMFCFSVELAQDDRDFELLPSLRYAHSERHVRELATRHGFDIVQMLRRPIREDQRQPVHGLFVYLNRRLD